jgi:hypothetical protein
MSNIEQEREIKKTLKQIFEYTGTDLEYVNNAQIITYVEWLIGRVQ